MSLGLIDKKLFSNVYKQKNANSFSSINLKDINILQLDASYYDESSEP